MVKPLTTQELKVVYRTERGKAHQNYDSLSRVVQEEMVTLKNGLRFKYRTSDNGKVKKALSEMYSSSAVDFLLAISGVEGYIHFIHDRPLAQIPAWVKKNDIPDLIRLANVNVITPELTIEMEMKPGILSKKRQEIVINSYKRYTRTPLAINILSSIYSYIKYPDGLFPSIIPTYESVKNWYDGGQDIVSYRFENFDPPVGLFLTHTKIDSNSKK